MSDDGPFRTSDAAPAALVELAAGAAAKRRELPMDVASSKGLRARAQLALGIHHAISIPSILFGTFGVLTMIVGAEVGVGTVVFGALMIPIGIAIDVAWWRSVKRRTAATIAAGERHPFAVTGYEVWLASERPLLDVHLRGPVARSIVNDAAAALDPDIAIEWLDDRLFRVAIPAQRIGGADESNHGGDPQAWQRFAERILAPLHQQPGIVEVQMGGSMRALPP